jgi:hypothetical protein
MTDRALVTLRRNLVATYTLTFQVSDQFSDVQAGAEAQDYLKGAVETGERAADEIISALR